MCNSKFNKMYRYMELCKELSPFVGISVTYIRMCLFILGKYDMNCDILMAILYISYNIRFSLLKLDGSIIFLHSDTYHIYYNIVPNFVCAQKKGNETKLRKYKTTQKIYGILILSHDSSIRVFDIQKNVKL